ncbi:hypothetical protein M8C21_000141 [Ambrosia artemisiifolia]|uniref:Uncharacterized protein n=1 Tax=Ambrosia artemisiifolia TaxID=4212 RepID=A0AAD5CW47_AMBAR|nr:hypothetical protein M8C21_000141 [Ambrosia artemisiifolia]
MDPGMKTCSVILIGLFINNLMNSNGEADGGHDDLKNLPHIQSYSSIQALNQNLTKSDRKHDLVIVSYVLAEIPSFKDRITIVR